MTNLINVAEAKSELAKRELSRRRLLDFILYNFPNYQVNWHHKLIVEALQSVERGTVKRLMLLLPPRHGKSEIASIQFPAWYLGKHPDKEVIAASYNADLAVEFGKKTRNLVRTREFSNVFTGIKLSEDSSAAGKWNTNKGGAYLATGIGGGMTGRGADILLLDDPIRDRADAESELIQASMWDWYRSVARTRLNPGGAIILIQCMVGETSVLMADGNEKKLRDVRSGDRIATYEGGKLSTSTVKHWANQGSDLCFTIKTRSGIVVRANKRHPFLVKRKEGTKWIKLKNLKIGDELLKAHGVVSYANYVKNQSNVLDIVGLTTTKRVGLKGIDHLPATLHLAELPISNTDMESVSKNTKSFSPSRVENVQYAESRRVKTSALIGVGSFASTTTTQPIRCADFSATIATLRSDTEKQKTSYSKPLDTYEIIPDEIVEIFESGYEDVFDIQVDRTENFIANGLVSHNTRWNERDLAGRILEGDKGEWKVLSFPAIATSDEEFRKVGEELWKETKVGEETFGYSLEALQAIERDIGPYDFSALYQQAPIDLASQEFKKEWFKTITQEELGKMNTRNYMTIDTAISQKSSADYTGFCDNSVNRENFWHLKTWKNRITPHELIEILFSLYQSRHYVKIGIEKTVYSDALKGFIDAEQRKRGIYLPITELKHNQTAKETRIRGLIPRYSSGSIFHILNECRDLESELLSFPKGRHDDVVDACLIGETMVLCERGNVSIKDICVGDKVMTRQGFKRVLASQSTGIKEVISNVGLTGTPNHPVITTRGTKDLQYVGTSDTIYLWNEKLSSIEEKSIIAIQNHQDGNIEFIFGGMTAINRLFRFTVNYGLMLMEKSQRIFTFTIKTMIQTIMRFLISNLFQPQTTRNFIPTNLNVLLHQNGQSKLHKNLLRFGMEAETVEFGTKSMLSKLHMEKNTQWSVLNVLRDIRRQLNGRQSSVPNVANINIIKENSDKKTQTTTRLSMVYNLEVEDAHEYFANGVLVHNCQYQTQVVTPYVDYSLGYPMYPDADQKVKVNPAL